MRLLFLLCCALSLPLFAAERVVTPNWAMASTLTAMGFPPLAMGDKRIYPLWMSDPVQPPSVVDLGERYRPNRELLAQLPLSLVFDNFFYTHLRALYPPDVPVVDVLFDGGNEAPQQSWATYVTATQQMGDAIGERAAADAYLQQVESALAAYGREVRAAAAAGAAVCGGAVCRCAPVADFCAEQFVPGFPGFDGAGAGGFGCGQPLG